MPPKIQYAAEDVKTDMKMRNSNIELMRIIAMFFIVAGHYLSYSGLLEATTGCNQVFSYLVGSGARVSVSLFLMIGVWFMVDNGLRGKHVLKLYCEIWFYGVAITAIQVVMRVPVFTRSILRVLFPFFLRSTWFGSAYISLLLISPFLHRILDWERYIVKRFLITLTIIIIPTVTIFEFSDNWFDVMLWFFYIYLLIGYYKKHLHEKVKIRPCISLVWGGVIYFGMAFGKMICFNLKEEARAFTYGYKLFSRCVVDYKQLPNLLCAFCIFYFFVKLKSNSNTVINWLTSGTFAVYIIHQVPPMESYLWTGILKCQEWGTEKGFIGMSLAAILGVMLSGMLLDKLRVKWIEARLVETKVFGRLAERVEKMFLV